MSRGKRHHEIMASREKRTKMKKILFGALALGLAVVPLLGGVASAQTPMSTTTLGTNIDSVSGQANDYFSVLLAKFWPFLLGATILVGVIYFGRSIIHRMFGK